MILKGNNLIDYLEMQIEVFRRLWLEAAYPLPPDYILDDYYIDMLEIVEKERASE